ncbi:MAG: Crp/Fnr family transcriptional regulator [Hyphomicrobium sp.]
MEISKKLAVSLHETDSTTEDKPTPPCTRIVDACEKAEKSILPNLAHHKILPQGHIILHESAALTSVAQILSGIVKLSKTLADGRQQIVGLRFASDFLGSPFKETSPYNAETITEVHLCSYDRTKFEQGLKNNRGIEHRLFQNTLDELDEAREWMLLLGRKYAGEKIASFLLMVAERTDKLQLGNSLSTPATFALPLTRAEIADYLGLTIETVSRQISELKAKNIISLHTNRVVSILDLNRLSALAEQEYARKALH